MKVHYYEQSANSDVSFRERDDASWVECGKHIVNEQVTINEDDVTCGSCQRAIGKRKAAAVAA